VVSDSLRYCQVHTLSVDRETDRGTDSQADSASITPTRVYFNPLPGVSFLLLSWFVINSSADHGRLEFSSLVVPHESKYMWLAVTSGISCRSVDRPVCAPCLFFSSGVEIENSPLILLSDVTRNDKVRRGKMRRESPIRGYV